MNKYERKADQVIDLHGYTAREAEVVLFNLVSDRKVMHARIIVGKGIHSKNPPLLRDKVKNFLNDHGIKYSQSKIENGGEGSLEVYFR